MVGISDLQSWDSIKNGSIKNGIRRLSSFEESQIIWSPVAFKNSVFHSKFFGWFLKSWGIIDMEGQLTSGVQHNGWIFVYSVKCSPL